MCVLYLFGIVPTIKYNFLRSGSIVFRKYKLLIFTPMIFDEWLKWSTRWNSGWKYKKTSLVSNRKTYIIHLKPIKKYILQNL